MTREDWQGVNFFLQNVNLIGELCERIEVGTESVMPSGKR